MIKCESMHCYHKPVHIFMQKSVKNCQSNSEMITFIVFYIVLPLTKSFEVNYCRLPCHINNKTVEHIMCTLKHVINPFTNLKHLVFTVNFQDCSVGPECKVKTKFNYTPELKSFTLDMHNYFRNKVAFGESLGQNKGNLPQAADMLELVSFPALHKL